MLKLKIADGLHIYGAPEALKPLIKQVVTYTIQEETFSLYEDLGAYIKVPRGALADLKGILGPCNDPKIRSGDQMSFEILPDVEYKTGRFYYQERVINELLKHNTCRLEASAGSGKTSMACLFMALLNKGPILFLCNRDKLINQFRATVKKVLGLETGIIQKKIFDIQPITVGSLGTVGRKGFNLDKIRNEFNVVFIDECHISSALTYRNVLFNLNCEYLIGLSATPDHFFDEEANRLMEHLLGRVEVKVEPHEIPGRITPRIYMKETAFNFRFAAKKSHPELVVNKLRHKLFDDLSHDPARDQMILSDTVNLVKAGYKTLVVTNRVEHALTLTALLNEAGIRSGCPYKETKQGYGVDQKKLDLITEQVYLEEIDSLVGTLKLFKEGFDCQPLSAIIFGAPFSGYNTTTMIQAIGRIQRYYHGKETALVLDYIDNSHPNPLFQQWGELRVENYGNIFGFESVTYI